MYTTLSNQARWHVAVLRKPAPLCPNEATGHSFSLSGLAVISLVQLNLSEVPFALHLPKADNDTTAFERGVRHVQPLF